MVWPGCVSLVIALSMAVECCDGVDIIDLDLECMTEAILIISISDSRSIVYLVRLISQTVLWTVNIDRE